jgi:hypothetical protein
LLAPLAVGGVVAASKAAGAAAEAAAEAGAMVAAGVADVDVEEAIVGAPMQARVLAFGEALSPLMLPLLE